MGEKQKVVINGGELKESGCFMLDRRPTHFEVKGPGGARVQHAVFFNTIIDKPEEMKPGFSKVVPSHLEKTFNTAVEFSSSTLLSAQVMLLFWL